MDINAGNLNILFTEVDTAAKTAFNAFTAKQIFDSCAMKVPSRSKVELHAWINQIPKIREWLGDRQVKNIQSNSLSIINRKFEGTIEMKREEIEDDQYGIYTVLATALGANAAVYPDSLLADTLCTNDNWGGDATPAAFFGTSRTYVDPNDASISSTISNYTASVLSTTTFSTAYNAMGSYTGHGGLPLEVKPIALLYGPSNRVTAFDILKNDFIAGSSTLRNPNQNLVQGIESPRLVGSRAAYWFLIGETIGIRGPVYQERMAAEFQRSRLDLNSDFVFAQDKFQYGVRMRGEAFKLFPHLIYGGGF